MRFELTDDQRAIQQTAKEFLASRYPAEEVRRLALEDERGFTDEQWTAIAELGWPALVVPEDDGGLGLGVVELAVLQEQLGYALAPTPLLSTIAAVLAIAAAGDDPQRAEWLPALAEGERRGTVAPLPPTGGLRGADADGGALTATLEGVPDAVGADLLVVPTGHERLAAVDLSADGVTIAAADGLDPTRRLSTVTLDGAPSVTLAAADGRALARARDIIAVAVAAESVGVAQRAMEMAVEHARDRQQFGRPIGAFQAVSHACAQMLLEVEGARSAVLFAAWALDDSPEEAALAAAMAKAYASDAGWRVPASALQVLGGIGFTWEHDLHFWLKRGRANAAVSGDARSHRRRVADLIGL
jgi:alkylation response protein AidB-like acyl-CoA dehydrogenase